jgi:hypothetical protein
MVSISDLRKEICEAVIQNIEERYNELLLLDDFPKDHMWFNNFWLSYVKDTEIQIIRIPNGNQMNVMPIVKFIPDPTNRIKIPEANFPSAIFNPGTLEPFLHDLDDTSRMRLKRHFSELVWTCLESSRQEIPSMAEIRENLNVNIDGFLARVEHLKEILRSIAPISGIEWNDTISSESVQFSKPTLQYLQNIEMLKHNKKDPNHFDRFYDRESPLVVAEFEFDWVPNPHDISVAQNLERLHQTAMRKFDTILNACRLIAQSPDRVGIGLIFHLDSSWTNYESTKLITESPLPNFKPILVDGRPIPRDESYYPKMKIHREELLNVLRMFSIIRNAAGRQPIEENVYLELLYAIEFYSKNADESDLDWKLLDLVKSMESLGNMINIRKGVPNRCQSAGKINYALGLRNTEGNLVKKAYALRSTKAAHSPGGMPIDNSIIIELQGLTRKIISESMTKIS